MKPPVLSVLMIALFLVSPSAVASFKTVHDLGQDAFSIVGVDPGDELGFSVAMLPDVNGDQISDLLISAPYADDNGVVYLIYGATGFGSSGTIDLNALGDQGVVIRGEAQDDQLGWCVASAGDLNHDGRSDFLISAPGHDPVYGTERSEAGRCYLIYGRDDFGQTLDLSSLSPGEGVIIDGADTFDMIGISLCAAGDFKGTGDAAILIGAPYRNAAGFLASGSAYLVYHDATIPFQVDLAALGTQGVVFDGSDNFEKAGFSVSGDFDFNGDGISDIVIGVPGAYYSHAWYEIPGRAYVVLGGSGLSDTVDLATIPGDYAAAFDGADINEQAGYAVLGVDDFNQDGLDDAVITAPLASPNGANSGRTYVVFGGAPPYAALDLGALGAGGITFNGVKAGDGYRGLSLGKVGDTSEDGKPDFAVGAVGANTGELYSAGIVYLMNGNRYYASEADLDSQAILLKKTELTGSKNADLAGGSVSGGGDVDNDGKPDLIIGARGHSTFWEDDVGRALFVPGQNAGASKWPWTAPSTGAGSQGENMSFVPIMEAWGDFTPGSSEGCVLAVKIDPSWAPSTGAFFGIWLYNSGFYTSGLPYNNQIVIWPLVDAQLAIDIFMLNSTTGEGFREISVPQKIASGKKFYLQVLWQNPDQVTYPFDLAASNCLCLSIP